MDLINALEKFCLIAESGDLSYKFWLKQLFSTQNLVDLMPYVAAMAVLEKDSQEIINEYLTNVEELQNQLKLDLFGEKLKMSDNSYELQQEYYKIRHEFLEKLADSLEKEKPAIKKMLQSCEKIS